MIKAQWDERQLGAVLSGLSPVPLKRALRKAGTTALRDMKSETSKRARKRKRLKASQVKSVIDDAKPRGTTPIRSMRWRMSMRGQAVPLISYPHRQLKRGVSVSVNRGKRTRVRSAFIARTRSGRKQILRREPGAKRLPILMLLGSRPVDAMLHAGEPDAVLVRGRNSFGRAWLRLLPMELEKYRR